MCEDGQGLIPAKLSAKHGGGPRVEEVAEAPAPAPAPVLSDDDEEEHAEHAEQEEADAWMRDHVPSPGGLTTCALIAYSHLRTGANRANSVRTCANSLRTTMRTCANMCE